MTIAEILLSTTQLSERLGIDPRSLERWRQVGGGPRFVRVGRLVRYRETDIADWLEENAVGSTQE